MNYKSGEAPQARDEVMGDIDGKPARGRVLAVRANGDVLVTRRAVYSGHTKPLVAEHQEVPAKNFYLIYRPCGTTGVANAEAVEGEVKKKAKPTGAKK